MFSFDAAAASLSDLIGIEVGTFCCGFFRFDLTLFYPSLDLLDMLARSLDDLLSFAVRDDLLADLLLLASVSLEYLFASSS